MENTHQSLQKTTEAGTSAFENKSLVSANPTYVLSWANKPLLLQPKLTIGRPDDPYEQEADRVAERVMRMPEPVVHGKAGSPLGNGLSCAVEANHFNGGLVQRRVSSQTGPAPQIPPVVQEVLQSPGKSLDAGTRAFFEPRFGHDFGSVRVHTDARAAESAQAVKAMAYTVGNNVVFGNSVLTDTDKGRQVLAHELTHIVQQEYSHPGGFLQRCPDPATEKIFDGIALEVKKHPEYTKLPPTVTQDESVAKTTVDGIITDARARDDCKVIIDKLKVLVNLPLRPAPAIASGNRKTTMDAKTAEAQRLAGPGKYTVGLEETASGGIPASAPKRKGKFGGGSYTIDTRDPNNIVIRARILLTKKGSGTDADVSAIISMQDGIEKAASTRGYLVDIDLFSDPGKADSDTFRVDVDPNSWQYATIWGGGTPLTYAHELHHMLAFPLDRYNYFSHHKNPDMDIPNRLYWFAQELKKPAGYNDPTSLMANAPHPSENDVCTVAGLSMASCIATRQKANNAIRKITAEFATNDERIRGGIQRYKTTDASTMMAVLREIFRKVSGLSPTEKARIQGRLSGSDALGVYFRAELSADQQTELMGIIK